MRPRKRLSRLAAALGAGLLLAAGGCLRLDETIVIRPDGSATLDAVYAMEDNTIQQMAAMKSLAATLSTNAAAPVPPGMFLFDEQVIRAAIAPLAEQGVAIEKLALSTRQGWRYVELRLASRTFEALARTPFLAPFQVSVSRDTGGHLVFAQQSPGPAAPPIDMGDPEVERDVSPALAGMRVVIRVTGPGPLLSSNGTRSADQTAVWEYDFDRDPGGTVAGLQNMNLRAVFDGRSAPAR